MKHCKVYKKLVVIFTVLLLFSFSCFSVFSYSYDDLTVNNKIYIPPLPSSEVDGYNYFICNSTQYGILLIAYDAPIYFNQYSSEKYVFFSSSYCNFKRIEINENWEWETRSTSKLKPDTTYVYLKNVSNFSDWNIRYSNVDLFDSNDIIYSSNSIYENFVIVNSYDEIPFPPDAPDYDSWFSSVFDAITDWFSGVLEGLATPFTAIAEGLNGVWQAVKNIPSKISDIIKDLFIPSEDIFNEFKLKFNEKFGFVGQIVDLGENFLNSIFGSTKPETNITLYGTSVTIIDWDIYDNYRIYIHGIIVLLSYIIFIPKLIKRLPSVIRGI